MGSNIAEFNILITFIKREFDAFEGLKETLKLNNKSLYEIELSAQDYEIVAKTEYSKYKFLFRIIYYQKIFNKIRHRLNKVISNTDGLNIRIYFVDEGVWGEFLNDYRRKSVAQIYLLNIQHGSFILKPIPYLKIRRIVNRISYIVFGNPIFGYDFGGSKSDAFFVYGIEEKKFVENRTTTSEIIVSPYICKYHFIKHFSSSYESNLTINKTILFGMQPPEISENCLFSESKICELMYPLFHHLNEKGYKIYFRLHPGTIDVDQSVFLLKKYKIFDLVELANSNPVEYYFSRSGTIISFHSTLIYDALITGKLPIAITGIMNSNDLTCLHEKVNIFGDWKNALNIALSKQQQYKIHSLSSIETETRIFFQSM